MRTFVLASLQLAVLLLAACGGDEGEASRPAQLDASPESQTDQAAEDGSRDSPDGAPAQQTDDAAQAGPPYTLQLSRPDPQIAETIDVSLVTGYEAAYIAPKDRPALIRFEHRSALAFEVSLQQRGGYPLAWSASFAFPETGVWQANVVTTSGQVTLTQTVNVPAPEVPLLRPPGLPVNALVHRIATFDPDRGLATFQWTGEAGGIGWIADPPRVVFVQQREGRNVLVAGDPLTGELTPLLTDDSPDLTMFAASPDGRRIIVSHWVRSGGGRANLRVFNTEREEITTVNVDAADWVSPAWSPDSQRVAVILRPPGRSAGDAPDRILILDRDGDEQLLAPLPASSVEASAWSADGRSFFLRVADPRPASTRTLLLRADPQAGTLTTVLETGAGIADIGAWTTDPETGALIVTWQDPNGTWRMGRLAETAATPAEIAVLSGARDILATAWGPQGHLAIAGKQAGTAEQPASGALAIWIYDPGAQALRALPLPASTDFFFRAELAWTHAGDRLFVETVRCCHPPGTQRLQVINVASGAVESSAVDQPFFALGSVPLYRSADGGLYNAAGERIAAVQAARFTLAASPDGTRVAALIEPERDLPAAYATSTDGQDRTVLGAPNRYRADGSRSHLGGPAFLIDEERLIVGGYPGQWELIELSTGMRATHSTDLGPPELARDFGGVSALGSISRDRRTFAVLRSREASLHLLLVDIATWEVRAVSDPLGRDAGPATSPAWHDDGRLAVGVGNTVFVLDGATAQTLQRIEVAEAPRALAWAGPQELFVLVSDLFALQLADEKDLSLVADLPTILGASLARSPDGDAIAIGAENGVWVWDGTLHRVSSPGRTGAAGHIAWSPDGSRLAYATAAGFGAGGWIQIANADGSGAYPLVEGDFFVTPSDPLWLSNDRIAYSAIYFSGN